VTHRCIQISHDTTSFKGEVPHGVGKMLGLLLAHTGEAPQDLTFFAADDIAVVKGRGGGRRGGGRRRGGIVTVVTSLSL